MLCLLESPGFPQKWAFIFPAGTALGVGPPATSLNMGARGGENFTSRWMGVFISRTGITEGRLKNQLWCECLLPVPIVPAPAGGPSTTTSKKKNPDLFFKKKNVESAKRHKKKGCPIGCPIGCPMVVPWLSHRLSHRLPAAVVGPMAVVVANVVVAAAVVGW